MAEIAVLIPAWSTAACRFAKNKMTKKRDKMQLAEVVGTWLAALTVVLGGLFGIFQFLDYKQTLRVERSMAFIDRYHDNEPLVESRVHIAEIMNRRLGEIVEVLQSEDLDQSELAAAYSAAVMGIVEEESLAGPLDQVFGFYEQILMCRELALCDDEVAASFFNTDGRAFVRSFYPHICHVRREWSNPEAYQRIWRFYGGGSSQICE